MLGTKIDHARGKDLKSFKAILTIAHLHTAFVRLVYIKQTVNRVHKALRMRVPC